MTITDSDLVAEVVDIDIINAANMGDVIVNNHGKGIGVVRAEDLTLTDEGGTASLVQSLFEFENAPAGLDYIKVVDVGNAEVHDIVTLNEAANLIESIVDCQAAGATACVENGGDLIIRLANGGNILCPKIKRNN